MGTGVDPDTVCILPARIEQNIAIGLDCKEWIDDMDILRAVYVPNIINT